VKLKEIVEKSINHIETEAERQLGDTSLLTTPSENQKKQTTTSGSFSG